MEAAGTQGAALGLADDAGAGALADDVTAACAGAREAHALTLALADALLALKAVRWLDEDGDGELSEKEISNIVECGEWLLNDLADGGGSAGVAMRRDDRSSFWSEVEDEFEKQVRATALGAALGAASAAAPAAAALAAAPAARAARTDISLSYSTTPHATGRAAAARARATTGASVWIR